MQNELFVGLVIDDLIDSTKTAADLYRPDFKAIKIDFLNDKHEPVMSCVQSLSQTSKTID